MEIGWETCRHRATLTSEERAIEKYAQLIDLHEARSYQARLSGRLTASGGYHSDKSISQLNLVRKHIV